MSGLLVEDREDWTHCEICKNAKGKDSLSWYVKQHADKAAAEVFSGMVTL